MENLAADFIINFNNPIEAEFELSEGGYDCSFELFASGTVWGSISGTLSNQTDLQAALDLKADKTELNTAIQNEATTRTESDTLLQNNINTLSQTVTANYNTLDGKIDTEISDRTAADTTLQNNIDAEALARQNADTVLQNNINTLSQTVTDNNTAINNRVDSVVSAFDDEIETINTNLSDLSDTVSRNYTTLDTKINNTKTSLEGDISDLSDTVTSNYNSLDARITTNTGNIATNAGNITTINSKIPNQASSSNQLADKDFVNSSIATNTANFIGTFNSVAELEAYSGTLTNNDYAFVATTDTAGNTLYDRYKWNGSEWLFEYELNNSSFTAVQWASINSGATSTNIGQITINANNITDLQTNKQNVISDLTSIRSNALAGKNASDTIATYGNIVTHNVSEFATSSQGALADTALQPNDNISELTNDAGYITAASLPTVNNGTLTIQANGTTVGTFTANQAGNTTANIVVPDSATWGNITGTLSNQTDLQNALDAKQDNLTAGTDLEIVGHAPTTVSGNGSVSLNNAIADGLISVTLTGGCEQNGTPTPTNPVDIICNNGAIKSSKNIFDKTLSATAVGSATTYWEIQVPNGTYTCSTNMPNSGRNANVWFDIQTGFSSDVNPVYASQPRTITVTEGVLYVAIRNGDSYRSLINGERWVQVEQGDTATTYHPYGIYIDGNIETISDGNGNTAIAEYLLSVGDYKDTQELLSGEITRNVGIKVLNGTEPWFYSDVGGNSTFYSSSTISTNVFGVPPYSNRYIGIPSASGRTDGNIYIININNNSRLDVVDNRFTNAADWKAYLSEQYYAGNPVIVVYAIGDSTSETTQAQTLTTQKGSNTISITQASINNLPISVNYNMSGTTVINFTNETGYTSFSEIKDKLAYYGTCTTGASTQNKIVDCNGFELLEGVSIRIKFTNAQTYNGQPTLNVNNTGAIGIALRGDAEGIRYMWQAGDVIEFTYDGTSWIWERGGVATTTYYGVTKLTSSATASSASLSLTASSLNSFSRYMVSGAQTYSTSTTYAVGDRVRYQYQTWECTSPTTGTWDENSWTALDALQIQIDNINANKVTESTVSGWGFTKNAGTVTSVNNTQPDANGNVTIPTRNVGEVITSTLPLTDAGLHLLDGSLLAYGSYQAFIDYIADLYDSGNYDDIFETEANWQSSVTTYGVCGKFVYDSVNQTVRLPKITGFTEGTIDPTVLGDLVEAGLPNITGKIPYMGTGGQGADTSSGAFNNNVVQGVGYGTSGSWNLASNVTFNASRSSSIYGNSSTVQPQAIKVLYYIVIANTTKTEIQVDIDDIATDLNGKADVDLSNLDTTGEKHFLNKSQVSNCILEAPNGVLTYSGNTITLKAGLKVLVPDGRNSDGTLKSIEVTLQNDITGTTKSYQANRGNQPLFIDSEGNFHYDDTQSDGYYITDFSSNGTYDVNYSPKTNTTKRTNGTAGSWTTVKYAYIGRVTIDRNLDVTYASIEQPINLFTNTDKKYIAGLPMPSGWSIDLTLGASGTTYTAPGNGWVSLAKVANAVGQYIEMNINNQIRSNVISPVSTNFGLKTFISVSHGQQFTINYNASGNVEMFKFTYALGEV
jgi:hypothetical protein